MEQLKALEIFLGNFTDVVITGASSGIGKSLVCKLDSVQRDMRVFNLSRSKPELALTMNILNHEPCDLSSRIERETHFSNVLEELKKSPKRGKILLINNSGFGAYGPFPNPDIEKHLEMLEVNVSAPVHLTGKLLPLMKRRGGAIMNIASTAAFQPTPYLATYGASKSFLLDWSLALGEDLIPDQIPVIAVCPGPTKTGFFKQAGFSEPPVKKFSGMSSDQVAVIALKAMAQRKSYVVCGFTNKLVSEGASLLPKSIVTRIASFILKKLRLEQFLK